MPIVKSGVIHCCRNLLNRRPRFVLHLSRFIFLQISMYALNNFSWIFPKFFLSENKIKITVPIDFLSGNGWDGIQVFFFQTLRRQKLFRCAIKCLESLIEQNWLWPTLSWHLQCLSLCNNALSMTVYIAIRWLIWCWKATKKF